MRFHAIAGLPRSGSTLLQNILNQNPAFHASSTSPIAPLLAETSLFLSTQAEVKSLLARDRRSTEERILIAMRGLVRGWYEARSHDAEVVFDKGRGWCHNVNLLTALWPQARIIVMVRDLRSVFASIERANEATPMFSLAKSPQEKTVFTRYDTLFAPAGMVGICLNGIEDMLRRGNPAAIYVQCEAFCRNPEVVTRNLYDQLGERWFPGHDFDDVKNTAEDLDALWLNKFEHVGAGKVRPRDPEEWRDHCPGDIASMIMTRFAAFNAAFGYA